MVYRGLAQPPPPRGRGAAARLLAWLAASLHVAFTVALASTLSDPTEIVFGIPPALWVVLALPLVAAALTAASAVFVVRAWRRGYWRPAGRVHYTLVTAAAVSFLAVLHYWKLLGYHVR
jgi:hypothetical protein